MKRFVYSLLIVFAVFLTSLHGDVIILEPEPVKICVRINNLNDFPDIVVFGLSKCTAFYRSNKIDRIKNNSCLKIHKACPLSFYVMKMDYYKQVDDLDDLDWDDDKNLQKLNLTVTAPSISKLYLNEMEYAFNLEVHNDSIFYLYKSKMTYKYSGPRPDSVRYFKNNVNPTETISVPAEDD